MQATFQYQSSLTAFVPLLSELLPLGSENAPTANNVQVLYHIVIYTVLILPALHTKTFSLM
jgi:hypothetical protein